MAALTKTRATTLGKFIALVLRHQPDIIGATLDPNGWLDTAVLLANTQQSISIAELEEVVRLDGKGRYAFNDDKTQIRAVQGHSVTVDAGERLLERHELPIELYHGTAAANIKSIMKDGLKPGSRQFVHLTADKETARTVGKRHSKAEEPIILTVLAHRATHNGFPFFMSENGVYLSKHVPAVYIDPV